MPKKKPRSRSFRIRKPRPPDPRFSPVCHLKLAGELNDHVVTTLREKVQVGEALSQNKPTRPSRIY